MSKSISLIFPYLVFFSLYRTFLILSASRFDVEIDFKPTKICIRDSFYGIKNGCDLSRVIGYYIQLIKEKLLPERIGSAAIEDIAFISGKGRQVCDQMWLRIRDRTIFIK